MSQTCGNRPLPVAVFIILILTLIPGLLMAQEITNSRIVVHPEWKPYFDQAQVQGAVVIYDEKNDTLHRYNEARCQEGFLPASTFKIYNALIGLDSGVLDGPEHLIKWDGRDRVLKSWNQDHTLRTAIRDSAVWYFRELARRVGKERMAAYIEKMQYGNRDISAGVDAFWLRGKMRISPNAQVRLLRQLDAKKLPVSTKAQETVRELIILEQTPEQTLRGKTGWVNFGTNKEPQIGWFVGWYTTADNKYFFAVNIESDQPGGEFAQARRDIAQKAFEAIKQ